MFVGRNLNGASPRFNFEISSPPPRQCLDLSSSTHPRSLNIDARLVAANRPCVLEFRCEGSDDLSHPPGINLSGAMRWLGGLPKRSDNLQNTWGPAHLSGTTGRPTLDGHQLCRATLLW